MDKASLRRTLRARRRAIASPASAAGAVRDLVMAHLPPTGCVAAYVSLPAEPPTGLLLQHLAAQGRRVLLPVAGPGGSLTWVDAAGLGGATPQAWGVPGWPSDPGLPPELHVQPDAVVVPCLSVDRNGVRLGQGGGYYDRYLAGLPAAVVTVGVVWSGEVVDRLPRQPHDAVLDDWVEVPVPSGGTAAQDQR